MSEPRGCHLPISEIDHRGPPVLDRAGYLKQHQDLQLKTHSMYVKYDVKFQVKRVVVNASLD